MREEANKNAEEMLREEAKKRAQEILKLREEAKKKAEEGLREEARRAAREEAKRVLNEPGTFKRDRIRGKLREGDKRAGAATFDKSVDEENTGDDDIVDDESTLDGQ